MYTVSDNYWSSHLFPYTRSLLDLLVRVSAAVRFCQYSHQCQTINCCNERYRTGHLKDTVRGTSKIPYGAPQRYRAGHLKDTVRGTSKIPYGAPQRYRTGHLKGTVRGTSRIPYTTRQCFACFPRALRAHGICIRRLVIASLFICSRMHTHFSCH